MTNILTLGGFGTGQLVYQVTNYASVQDAIDQVPDNATLFLPPNEYIPPDANGWIIDKPMTILGAGHNDNDSDVCTVFRPYNSGAVGGAPNSRVFKVAAGVQRVFFKNFIIYPENIPTTTGTGDGIQFDCSTQINYCGVEDVQIWYMGRNGIFATGGTFNESWMRTIYIAFCRDSGIKVDTTGPDLNLFNVGLVDNLVAGAHLLAPGLVANSLRATRNGSAAAGLAQLYFSGCHGFSVNGMDMENFETSTTKRGLHLENCRGGVINNPRVHNPTEVTNTIGIYAGTGNRGITVLGGTASNVHYWIQLATGASSRGWVVQPPGPTAVTATCPALISMTTNTSATATSSGGHIELPTMTRTTDGDAIGNTFIAGIALPSVNDKANITNPNLKDGWLIYDSSDGFLYIRSGGAWVKVGAQ